jgi:hypothetical protein
MPTLAQLQAEPYWGREIVTDELRWLGAELCRRTGRPADAFGTKGNAAHLRGAHRSQEWLLKSAYCTNRTYTVQAGLTGDQLRYVAGVDFTPDDVEAMIAQSRRLMAAVKSGELEAVRELYCNVDGDQVVDGWDNVRDRAASSDSSHLWHWHLTIDRRRLRDRALMARIVDIALGDDVTREEIDEIVYRTSTIVLAGIQPAGYAALTAPEPYRGQLAQAVKFSGQAIADLVARAPVPPAVDVAALAAALAPLLGVDQAAVVAALESPEGQAALVRADNTAEDS